MKPDLFSLREQEIFNTLLQLRDCDFAVIGGYAVNAYALPRFSVDCDIVVNDAEKLHEIEKILLKIGYKKEDSPEMQYSGNFARYEKKLENSFSVSIDVLIGKVTDRMTGVTFSAEWISQHSEKKHLKGKTITEEIQLKIIDIDALIVMKIISCRATDIRDVFMMLPNAKNKEWIKSEISSRYDLKDRIAKMAEKVASKQFKDGLSGIYGYFDAKVFEKHKKAIISLQNSIILM